MIKRNKTEERRQQVLKFLKSSSEPVTGNELARRCKVSRQIIVGDITLLKARNEPIIATPSGYIYFAPDQIGQKKKTRIIASQHSREETEQELLLIVDCGVTVRDVRVEHPIYGELTASIMVGNRRDVSNFIEKLETTNASLLAQLTDGIHLHTLEAQTEDQLQQAIAALQTAGFLIE